MTIVLQEDGRQLVSTYVQVPEKVSEEALRKGCAECLTKNVSHVFLGEYPGKIDDVVGHPVMLYESPSGILVGWQLYSGTPREEIARKLLFAFPEMARLFPHGAIVKKEGDVATEIRVRSFELYVPEKSR